jgi:ATP-dependent DNA helicase RecG
MWVKIFEACKDAGLPEPEIASLDGGILVTLHTYLVVDDGGQIGGQIMTERQREVLNLIVHNNKITRKELAEQLGIAESAIQKHLKVLTDLNVISRVGTRNGYWIIAK